MYFNSTKVNISGNTHEEDENQMKTGKDVFVTEKQIVRQEK
jgi:hypothetical protein